MKNKFFVSVLLVTMLVGGVFGLQDSHKTAERQGVTPSSIKYDRL